MNILDRIHFLLIRHNNKMFNNWILSLRNRTRNCGSNEMLYVMESITNAKIYRMNKDKINIVKDVLCFHSTFDDIHLRRILNRYINQVGVKKSKKTLKILSTHLNDEKNVFLTDIIKLYLNDYTFVEPENLTFC